MGQEDRLALSVERKGEGMRRRGPHLRICLGEPPPEKLQDSRILDTAHGSDQPKHPAASRSMKAMASMNVGNLYCLKISPRSNRHPGRSSSAARTSSPAHPPGGFLGHEEQAWRSVFLAPHYFLSDPFIVAAADSFFRVDFLSGARTWVGLGNYLQVVSDPEIRAAFVRSFVWTVVNVAVQATPGVGIALLLNAHLLGPTPARGLVGGRPVSLCRFLKGARCQRPCPTASVLRWTAACTRRPWPPVLARGPTCSWPARRCSPPMTPARPSARSATRRLARSLGRSRGR